MMKSQIKGEHGAVTVMLAALMVPVLLVTAVFIDGARFVSAESVIRSNQELAINNVLAQHDPDLHRMFGLLATLSDAGLLDEANGLMLQSLAGDPGAGDLLRIDVNESKIIPVSGASLAEADIIAGQITEYMKYRAPLNMVGEILNSLDWLSNLKEKIDLMKKRVEYFKKINDLLGSIREIDDLAKSLGEQIAALNGNILQLATDTPYSVLRDAIDMALEDDPAERQERDDIDERLSATTSAITNGQENIKGVLGTLEELFGVDGESGKVADLIKEIDELFGAKEEYTSAVEESSGTTEEKDALTDEADESVSILEDIKQDLQSAAEDLVNQFTSDVKESFEAFIEDLIGGFTGHFSNQYTAPTLADIDYDLIEAVVNDLKSRPDDPPQTFTQVMSIMFPQGISFDVGEIIPTAVDSLINSLKEAVTDTAGKVDIWGTIKSVLFEQVPASVQAFATMVEEFAGNTAWDESRIVGGEPGDVVSEIIPGPDSFGSEDGMMDSISDGGDGGILGAMGKLVEGIGGMLSTAYDNILVASYISGHFTHAAMERDGTPTRINHSVFDSCYKKECRAELEYILTGENGSKIAFGMVFGLRIVTNMIAATMDKRVQVIRSAVMVIPIIGQGIALLLTPALAIVQSVVDMQVLIMDRGKVPLYSNQLSIFSPDMIGKVADITGGGDNAFTEKIQDLGPGGSASQQPLSAGPELSYMNYMTIFLFIAMLGSNEGVMSRTGTIIEYQMRYNNQDFRLKNAFTAYYAVTDYSVEPLFFSIIAPPETANRFEERAFRFTGKQTYALGF